MIWRATAERLALLELLVRGALKRRQAQGTAWDTLAELPWTRQTGRRGEVRLVEAHRHELVGLLDRVWPGWGDGLAALTARGLTPTPEGWSALQDAQRAEAVLTLPDQVNRHTAAALVAPHSKATLTERRLTALGAAEATHDGAVRLRPPSGLRVHTPSGDLDLSAIATVLGEVSLPERALSAGLTFEGPVRALLLVENLGVFCDLPPLDGWLIAHVAGWDTATVAQLLGCLNSVPAVHFGDLDPNGVRIFQHLRGLRADLRWFVPDFWRELIEPKGQPGAWPGDLDLNGAPSWVEQLRERSVWLEQEPLALDPRTVGALQAMLVKPV